MPGMNQPARKRRGPITLLYESRRFRRTIILSAVLLPVLYVASFGPACWLANSDYHRWLHPVAYAYHPFVAAVNLLPPVVRRTVGQYSGQSKFGMDMLDFLTMLYAERSVTVFGIQN